jgi:glycine/D-amino acid oxidase-like deaminating enzyme
MEEQMREIPQEFELVVIGGGPAGIVGATTAATFGKTVAVVDSHHELGGAGANTGAVPSKTLRETALALSGMRSRNLYGVDLSLRREATVADFLRAVLNTAPIPTWLEAMAITRGISYPFNCMALALALLNTERVSRPNAPPVVWSGTS